MSENWKPDTPIAETFIWPDCYPQKPGDARQCVRVYTFERDSSAADYGARRFQETHVYKWSCVERENGEWLGQFHGHGIAFHNAVVEGYQRHGEFTEDSYDSYRKTQQILAEAVRKASHS